MKYYTFFRMPLTQKTSKKVRNVKKKHFSLTPFKDLIENLGPNTFQIKNQSHRNHILRTEEDSQGEGGPKNPKTCFFAH